MSEGMDKDWLIWHQNPKKPDFIPPAGAVDAHCHVFGPADQFPFAPTRKYTPCDASKDQLFALRDHLGFSCNVIVQASCHGKNNDALVDALEHSNDLARGVAVVSSDVTDAELERMDKAGVRGVRFNFVRRLVDPQPDDVYQKIAARIKELGWHIIVYLEAADFEERIPFLKSMPVTVVFDHMARPDVSKGADHPDFQQFFDIIKDEKFWTKVSCPERLSVAGPPYSDVIPFARKLVEAYPDRVLWGTDWPHPNMKSHMPDDGLLTDIIPQIAVTQKLQQALLVDNPMRLYWER